MLQWVSYLIAVVGVFLVLLAHGHYTIDIIVAYYITTRLFWTYHTLTNNAFLIKVTFILAIYFFLQNRSLIVSFLINRICSTQERTIIWHANGGSATPDSSKRMYADRCRMNLNGRYHGRDAFNQSFPHGRVNIDRNNATPYIQCIQSIQKFPSILQAHTHSNQYDMGPFNIDIVR